jgi:hypothetical protein
MCGDKMPKMLCIEILDKSGRVVEEKCIDKEVFEKYVSEREDDSTYNWITLIGAIFQSVAPNDSLSLSLVNVDGNSVSAYFKYPWTSPPSIFSTNYDGLKAYISLGTDSTPPIVSDYKLRAKVIEKEVERISIDATNRVVSLISTITFTTATTIYEAGLELEVVGLIGGTYTKTRILLDRTVITGGINVQANQGLRVTYRFSL